MRNTTRARRPRFPDPKPAGALRPAAAPEPPADPVAALLAQIRSDRVREWLAELFGDDEPPSSADRAAGR